MYWLTTYTVLFDKDFNLYSHVIYDIQEPAPHVNNVINGNHKLSFDVNRDFTSKEAADGYRQVKSNKDHMFSYVIDVVLRQLVVDDELVDNLCQNGSIILPRIQIILYFL